MAESIAQAAHAKDGTSQPRPGGGGGLQGSNAQLGPLCAALTVPISGSEAIRACMYLCLMSQEAMPQLTINLY